ncbi:GNAT family N-acetyltransferase [Ostreiculturibacter nitratireducens]|uniref:GNAT family N-acetyltransferase n=1 Tax=Ostreiculturibacter nitratireducens TaxID=3075226 RepID=UPI0031B5C134
MNLYDVIDATWPAARCLSRGPWKIREGLGGGSRVSATTAEGAWTEDDIPLAETAQAELGQKPLFMIRDGDGRLDAALDARGYHVADAVTIYAAPVATLARHTPPVTTFRLWPMLEIQRELWADGGVGPERLAVMERAPFPKTTVLGRINDRAAGTAFIAAAGETAMLHALHVIPSQRRQGIATHMMREAARWAQDVGAKQLSVLVTQANADAAALYASLEMEVVGHYYYRSKQA